MKYFIPFSLLLFTSICQSATYEARFRIDGITVSNTPTVPEKDVWNYYDSIYSEWSNSGDLYSCYQWLPSTDDYLSGVSFKQNGLCKQKQIRNVQTREINNKTSEIRNSGLPTEENKEIEVNTTRDVVGTQISFVGNLSATSIQYINSLLVGYRRQVPINGYNHGNSMSKTENGYQIHFNFKKDLGNNTCNITTHVTNGAEIDTNAVLSNSGPLAWLGQYNYIIVYNGSNELLNIPYTVSGGANNFARMQTDNISCSVFDIYYNNPSLLNKVKFIKK